MKIVVLICDGIFGQKPVFIDSKYKIYDKNLYYLCNPNDLYAIDLAMEIKREVEGVDITAISIGNARAANLVKKSLIIGVDRGIWGDCDNLPLENSYDIGSILANVIEQYCNGFDILMLGNCSQDYGFGLIGSLLAHNFGLNIFDNVSLIENINKQEQMEKWVITFQKKMEKGCRLICESSTPIILGVAGSGKGINHICLGDIIRNSQRDVEVIKIEGILNTNNVKQSSYHNEIIFDGYHEPRPRPKKIPVLDSSMSAMDRLKNITAGNMPKKSTNMFEGEAEFVATEFIKYMARS